MKKITLLSLGVFTFSALTLGQAAYASVEAPEAKTDATVQFEVDETTKPPVTPPTEGGNENGGGTVDPSKPGTDGDKGDGNASFNITHVSNFRFNEKAKDADGKIIFENGSFEWTPIKLNANGMTLWAYGTDLTLNRQNSDGKWINDEGEVVEDEADAQKLTYQSLPNFVQVTDNRGNKKVGWKLEVSRTEFTNGEDILEGATLSLNNPFAKGPDEVTEPTYFEESLEISTSAGIVMDAAAGTGTGSWTLSFGNVGETATVKETENEDKPVTYGQLALENGKPKSGVKLEVPAKAQAQADKVYTSQVTWTLSSVPED